MNTSADLKPLSWWIHNKSGDKIYIVSTTNESVQLSNPVTKKSLLLPIEKFLKSYTRK